MPGEHWTEDGPERVDQEEHMRLRARRALYVTFP